MVMVACVSAGVWTHPQQHSGGLGAALSGDCAGSSCEHLFNIACLPAGSVVYSYGTVVHGTVVHGTVVHGTVVQTTVTT